MPAERFLLQLLSEPEGLWGYNTEETEEASLEKERDPECQTLSPWIQLLLKTVPSSASQPYRRLGGCDDSVLCVVLAGSRAVIRLNTRLGVSI